MRTLLIRIAAALLMLSITGGGLRVAGAVSSTGDVSEEDLGTVMLNGMPEGPSNIVFARMTVPSGATATLAPVGGSSVHLLVSGSWSFQLTQAPGTVVPAATGTMDGTPAGVPAGDTLAAGSYLVVSPQTGLEVRNTGAGPAVSLVVSVAEEMNGPMEQGVTWQPIGDPVAVPEGPIQVDLTRVELPPETTTDQRQVAGPEMIDVVSGPVTVVLNPGQLRISRATGEQETLRAGFEDPLASPDPFLETDEEEGGIGMTELQPGTPIPGTGSGMDSGDGAVLKAGGGRVFRSAEDAPAVIILVEVQVTETSPVGTPPS